MTRISLSEASERQVLELPDQVARGLSDLRVATVEPDVPGSWRVSAVSKVGSFTVGDWQVDVKPKTSIAALSFLLGYERSQRFWRDEDVLSDENAHPSSAIAFSLGRLIARATAGGILRGYHSESSVEMTIRGRWDLATQIKRSPGLNVPAHLVAEEYDSDIPENRILATAIDRLLREVHVHGSARQVLAGLSRRFDGVARLRHGHVPVIVETRLNRHYAGALHLARIVLRSGSVEQLGSAGVSAGFLLTMSTVFEQFVGEAVSRAAIDLGLRGVEQSSSLLDRDGYVTIRPDLVLLRDGVPAAVIDAKYKVEKSERYPNADVYQAITYALRLGLTEAHLVYARGESQPRELGIVGAGVVVHLHALDLDLSPTALLKQVDELVGRIVREQVAGPTSRLPVVAGALCAVDTEVTHIAD